MGHFLGSIETFFLFNGLGRIWALWTKLMRLEKIAFNRLYIPGILAILIGLPGLIIHEFYKLLSLNEDIHN